MCKIHFSIESTEKPFSIRMFRFIGTSKRSFFDFLDSFIVLVKENRLTIFRKGSCTKTWMNKNKDSENSRKFFFPMIILDVKLLLYFCFLKILRFKIMLNAYITIYFMVNNYKFITKKKFSLVVVLGPSETWLLCQYTLSSSQVI